MGLHRDGTHYGLSPVEVHVRRMVWYQLCFLDIRTCEATGPRPQIRREDFDTSLPLNVNDVDLESKNPPTKDSSLWTDMTFSRIRFEVNEMHRFTWMERPRLERKKTTLTAVLLKVQNFIAVMDKKFLPMLDKSRPVARMALLVYKMMTLRLHIMLLHRYAGNHARAMPERLRKILLTSGVQQVECAMAIETDPALQTWSWYLGEETSGFVITNSNSLICRRFAPVPHSSSPVIRVVCNRCTISRRSYLEYSRLCVRKPPGLDA